MLRALADPHSQGGWETWTSPILTLVRPAGAP